MLAPDHAALMDGVYGRQRHIYDLTRAWFLFGRDRLIRDLASPRGGTVLEIGCGTARNLVHVAARYPEARLFGIDISASMLATAASSVAARGLSERIALGRGDASSFDAGALFGQDRFNRIFFSYSLSMIPVWEEALEHACTLLAPGGRLMAVDFSGQKPWPGLFRSAFRRFLANNHVTPRLTLKDSAFRLATQSGLAMHHERLPADYAQLLTLTKP